MTVKAGLPRFLDPGGMFLLGMAVLLTWGQVQQRAAAAKTPAVFAQAGQEARMFELLWALGGRMAPKAATAENPHKNGWNAAVEAVLLAEAGRGPEALSLLAQTPRGAFHDCWKAAYDSGPMPDAQDVGAALKGLGGGLAAKYMEASLIESADLNSRLAEDIRMNALGRFRERAHAVFGLLFLMFIGAAAGIVLGIRMWVKRVPPEDTPQFRMAGAAVVRVFLGWYVAFLASATAAAMINGIVPLGVWLLPLAYALHAAAGLAFLCIAEGAPPARLFDGLCRKNHVWLWGGFKFLLVALGTALALTLAISPFMPDGEAPQRELVELIRSLDGLVPFLAVFFTVAILGPVFEEVFFRGFLLSALRRGLPTPWALALSSALFGAFHLSLTAMPVLAVLGAVMGLAFLRTGDIRAAIFVHACWNGGVFLFQQLLYGV